MICYNYQKAGEEYPMVNTYFDWNETIMETLGIEITEFTQEKVVATMPVTPKTHQPFGIMHGGVSAVIAETVASSGSYLFIDREHQKAVGLEINANHISSVSEGMVKAVGIPVHVGRSTLVWDVRIYDESEKLVCISRCTIAVIDTNS
jgi:1,4-dihydroxy-2-naphthoyl-CoA hydrolase